jgi:hypothetical protein
MPLDCPSFLFQCLHVPSLSTQLPFWSSARQKYIREWWERKIINYIKNYARINKLTIVKADGQFFSETHKGFLEAIPEALFASLNQPNAQTNF